MSGAVPASDHAETQSRKRRHSGRPALRRTLPLRPTEGFPVSTYDEHAAPHHVPAPGESSIPELEVDETVAPRPEEELADLMRAQPDVEDHTRPDSSGGVG